MRIALVTQPSASDVSTDDALAVTALVRHGIEGCPVPRDQCGTGFDTKSLWPSMSPTLAGRAALVQPCNASIQSFGEWSLVYFHSEFSHALLQFRRLRTEDQDQLWNWLHIALWDPPPAGLRPRDILEQPRVRIYAEDWGRPGDVGLVAVVGGQDAGACWMRALSSGVGLAFVDMDTPQLGIALEPAYQNQGYGRLLLLASLAAARAAGFKQVSLTVHPENPAIRMYERCGFTKRGLRANYYLMVVELC